MKARQPRAAPPRTTSTSSNTKHVRSNQGTNHPRGRVKIIEDQHQQQQEGARYSKASPALSLFATPPIRHYQHYTHPHESVSKSPRTSSCTTTSKSPIDTSKSKTRRASPVKTRERTVSWQDSLRQPNPSPSPSRVNNHNKSPLRTRHSPSSASPVTPNTTSPESSSSLSSSSLLSRISMQVDRIIHALNTSTTPFLATMCSSDALSPDKNNNNTTTNTQPSQEAILLQDLQQLKIQLTRIQNARDSASASASASAATLQNQSHSSKQRKQQDEEEEDVTTMLATLRKENRSLRRLLLMMHKDHENGEDAHPHHEDQPQSPCESPQRQQQRQQQHHEHTHNHNPPKQSKNTCTPRKINSPEVTHQDHTPPIQNTTVRQSPRKQHAATLEQTVQVHQHPKNSNEETGGTVKTAVKITHEPFLGASTFPAAALSPQQQQHVTASCASTTTSSSTAASSSSTSSRNTTSTSTSSNPSNNITSPSHPITTTTSKTQFTIMASPGSEAVVQLCQYIDLDMGHHASLAEMLDRHLVVVSSPQMHTAGGGGGSGRRGRGRLKGKSPRTQK